MNIPQNLLRLDGQVGMNRDVARAMGESMPARRNSSFFRNVASLYGHTEGATAYGSLRHSSLGMPLSLDPSIEKKLSRARHAVARGLPANHIPTDVSEITKDWMRLVLNQYRLTHCGLPAVSKDDIVDINVFNCKKSVGDFSSTYQVDVTVDDENSDTPMAGGERKCFSFIAKLLPADDPGRACVFEANLLEKEIELYFELMPSLKQFLRKNAIDRHRQEEKRRRVSESASQKGGFQIPKGYGLHSGPTFVDALLPQCIYSAHNNDGAGVLVFLSCKSEAFEDCSDPNGLPLTELMWVVKAMAKFHAAGRAFLAKHETNAVERRYTYLTEDMYSKSSFVQEVNGHLCTYESFLKTAEIDLLSSMDSPSPTPNPYLTHDSLIEARRQFSRIVSVDTWQLVQGFSRYGPQSLTTICHGELWERNLLFRRGNNHRMRASPPHDDDSNEFDCNVKVLDWKNAKIATATMDLAFLMLSSTNFALRSESTSAILKTYHETFCGYLRKMNAVNVLVEEPTFEELERDYHHSLEYALIQAICMFVQQMHFYNTEIESFNPDDDESMSEEAKKNAEDAVDKLRTYERRALNIFRDVELVHIARMAEEAGGSKAPPKFSVATSDDHLVARSNSNEDDLAGLQDPENLVL